MGKLVATSFLLGKIAPLVAAQSAGLGSGATIRLRLAKNPFTPSPQLVIGDLTEADFGGYASKLGTAGGAFATIDPKTGLPQIFWRGPSVTSDLRFSTTSTTNLPQTIFGWYLQRTDGGLILLAADVFPVPIELTLSGQTVVVPWPSFLVSSKALG